MKRWIRIAAILLLFLICFSACQTETDPPAEDSSDSIESSESSDSVQESEQTPQDSEQQPEKLKPEDAIVLSKGGETDYVLVRDDAASTEAKTVITGFTTQFWSKTQTNISVKTDDKAAVAKEIIIAASGRSEVKSVQAKITAPGGNGYRISVEGEKIVVACPQEMYLDDALLLLAGAIEELEDGSYGIPRDYVGKLDVPTYRETGNYWYAGEENYVFYANNTSQNSFNSYLSSLKTDGFELQAKNTIGESQFFTYIKESTTGNMMVHTMFHPTLNSFRMTYGPMEYLPSPTKIESTGGTASITQKGLQMVYNGMVYDANGNATANNGAPGMSYVIELEDGRFIIFDGGNSDGMVTTVKNEGGKWVKDQTVSTTDARDLYDFLCKKQSKPTIALWVISHPHGDHMNLANVFLAAFHSKVDVEMVAYNFPDFDSYQGVSGISGMRGIAEKFQNNIAQYYPNAKTWIMHTGQRQYFPGCEIEVCGTVEDYYCSGNALTDGNNTTSVVRITLNGKTIMMLGDAYPVVCQFMSDAYGSALESDILQLAHHGFNGGVYDLYVDVNPKICFWPCDDYRFANDSRNLGSGSYTFNYYLRNTKWTRDDGSSGVRVHYTAERDTTIECKE